MVDLTCPKDFTIVKEISAADQIYDPQKYVVTGVNSQIIQSISGEKYYTVADGILYQSFCELDLAELERVSKFKTIQSLKD